AFALAAVGAAGQTPGGDPAAKKLKNPVPATAESVTAGQQLYQKYCRFCHGADAKGNGPMAPKGTHPPDLTDAEWTYGSTDGEIFGVRPDARQPIAFPHSVHIAKGLTCTDYCHESAAKGPIAGLPSVKTCMICHDAIATDRPIIQQLTAYQKRGLDISWQRVYG